MMSLSDQPMAIGDCLNYDVVVIGGGISGVIAAAASAKTGAKTLLVEASTFLGGVVTMGPLEALMTQHDVSGQVIAGMGQELLDILTTYDPQARCVEDTTGYCKTIIPYNPEMMKLAMWNLLQRYGVDALLETALETVVTQNNKIVLVILRHKNGQLKAKCKSVVDSSGNGCCTRLAGNEIMIGDDTGKSQPVTVLARLGGVDIPLLKEYVRSHKDDFKTFGADVNSDAPNLHLWGFSGALRQGFDKGDLSLLRNEIHMMQSSCPDQVIINYSRMDINPNDPFEASAAQYAGLKQVHELYRYFQKHISAFRNSYLIQSGYVGIRESGRAKGRYILTRNDVLSGCKSSTGVAMGAFPIDIHQPGDGMKFERVLKGYSIPMECLEACSIDNLFLAGRCISTTFEANASCRISMTCMATGHAAGVMAAVCASDRYSYSYEAVQTILKEQQAIL